MKKIFPIFSLLVMCFAFQIGYGQDAQKSNISKTVTLELGKAVEDKLTNSVETHRYQFRLNENQYAKIVVEQVEVDIAAGLFGADGNFVTRSNDEVRIGKNEIIEITASAAGIYSLDIQTTLKKSAAGTYKIRLEETREATARDRAFFEAHTLDWQASALSESAKYSEALTPASRALEIAEKGLGADDALVGSILTDLGNIHINIGKYPEALALFERAVAVSEKSLGADNPQTLLALYNLGICYNSMDDKAKAERIYRQVLASNEKVLGAEHFRVGNVVMSLGLLSRDLGDYAQAETYFKRALTIFQNYFGAENRRVAKVVNYLGSVYLDRRENDLAAQYFQKALDIYDKTGAAPASYIPTLNNIGIIYRRQKQFEKALEIYNRVLLIDEKKSGKETSEYATILSNTANIYYDMGDIEKALEIQRQVRAIAEKSVGLYHISTLNSIISTSKYYVAQGNAAGALEYQKLWDERYEKVLATNLTIGSERQKLMYIGDQLINDTSRTIWMHLNLAKNNQSAVDAAALVVLQRKGRVLDAVADNIAALRLRANKDDVALLDRLSELDAKLAKLTLNKPAKMSLEEDQKQIADLEAEKETLEKEINDRSAEFAIEPPTVTLEAIKAEIPQNAALVEFAVYYQWNPKTAVGEVAFDNPRYIAYILRRDGATQFKELGDAKLIDEVVDEWRKALRDPKRKDAQPLARAVDALVMQPVRAVLGDAQQLLISPDGELNLMPFEALVDENNRYLIENYSFGYLSSGRDLLRMKTARASKSDALIIANPQFGESLGEQTAVVSRTNRKLSDNKKRRSVTATRDMADTYFAPLGATQQEARSIQSLFPDALFLTGAQATETALKQANAPAILHIATHGFFLEDENYKDDKDQAARRGAAANADGETEKNPLLRSGLALAGANRRGAGGGSSNSGDDGILTALEASGLNLWGTKLVVLSACDTGLGEIKNGEGVYGLRRSFVLAGAESMVMSLWSVSDAVTRELMTNYYKNLKAGMGRGAALRAVQLEMLKGKERTHPFYWAAFIESGEWANLDGKR